MAISQQSFSRAYRVRRPAEYRHVFENDNQLLTTRSFRLHYLPNSLNHPRLGVIASKKCSKLAVRRNWIKRFVRNHFRLHRQQLGSIDIVIIATKRCLVERETGAVGLTPVVKQQAHKDINKLWRKLIANTSCDMS